MSEDTKRSTLTSENVLVAGVELADEIGIDALTIRKLADRLGVGAMTIYDRVPVVLGRHVFEEAAPLGGMYGIAAAPFGFRLASDGPSPAEWRAAQHAENPGSAWVFR